MEQTYAIKGAGLVEKPGADASPRCIKGRGAGEVLVTGVHRFELAAINRDASFRQQPHSAKALAAAHAAGRLN